MRASPQRREASAGSDQDEGRTQLSTLRLHVLVPLVRVAVRGRGRRGQGKVVGIFGETQRAGLEPDGHPALLIWPHPQLGRQVSLGLEETGAHAFAVHQGLALVLHYPCHAPLVTAALAYTIAY